MNEPIAADSERKAPETPHPEPGGHGPRSEQAPASSTSGSVLIFAVFAPSYHFHFQHFYLKLFTYLSPLYLFPASIF